MSKPKYDYLNAEVDILPNPAVLHFPQGVAVEQFGSGWLVHLIDREIPQGEDFSLACDSLVIACREAKQWVHRLRGLGDAE